LSFNRKISALALASRRLRSERERSMYGDEAIGIPPGRLYTSLDAIEATKDAAFAIRAVRRLLSTEQSASGECARSLATCALASANTVASFTYLSLALARVKK